MPTFKLCSRMFLCIALVILAGCKSKEPATTTPKMTPHTLPVMINDCAAPDVTVHENDVVDWQAGDHDYTVTFKDPNEPTANPFKVVHGGAHHPHAIRGHGRCDHLGPGEFYCKYSLTKDNQTSTCADPGVHIIP